MDRHFQNALLPGVAPELIRVSYSNAPGNEIESGKFSSPESSAALVANTFGFFLDRPAELPPLPGTETVAWPARTLTLEATVRFPWHGGRHPCLDVLIVTDDALLGVESKRYEPFRQKSPVSLSSAYWRPVWGGEMAGFERTRDSLRAGATEFKHLDAAQLIKHAFGLRTAAHALPHEGRRPILFYLYCEPEQWPNGREVSAADREVHRHEVAAFADMVGGDEVLFLSSTYNEVLASWEGAAIAEVGRHAAAVRQRFSP